MNLIEALSNLPKQHKLDLLDSHYDKIKFTYCEDYSSFEYKSACTEGVLTLTDIYCYLYDCGIEVGIKKVDRHFHSIINGKIDKCCHILPIVAYKNALNLGLKELIKQ